MFMTETSNRPRLGLILRTRSWLYMTDMTAPSSSTSWRSAPWTSGRSEIPSVPLQSADLLTAEAKEEKRFPSVFILQQRGYCTDRALSFVSAYVWDDFKRHNRNVGNNTADIERFASGLQHLDSWFVQTFLPFSAPARNFLSTWTNQIIQLSLSPDSNHYAAITGHHPPWHGGEDPHALSDVRYSSWVWKPSGVMGGGGGGGGAGI